MSGRGTEGAVSETFAAIGLALAWLGFLIFRLLFLLLTVLVIIGVAVGIWRRMTPLPETPSFTGILEFPFVAIGYVVDYAAVNWLPIAIGCTLWCAISSKRMLKNLDQAASPALLAQVAILNYFKLEVETDGMKQMRELGAWQFTKNCFNERVIFWLLGSDPTRDELSSKPIRGGALVSFDGDLRDKIDPIDRREAPRASHRKLANY